MSEVKGTKALELWCKRLIKDCPNVQIDNMTTSWRNGIAFCALVHHFRPDLIDVSTLKPENIYENNQQAFSIAEKHLGIPALLDPEDMVENEVPDRLSILTYLSQFYQRLGHTVNTKASESESKSPEPPSTSSIAAPFKFGKTSLDKCAACGLPVYLAQRLIVAHKLYHRRCFRCSKCSGHLNPKNFQLTEGSEFCCDSCKNEKAMQMPSFLNNNDQIGMLAFHEDMSKEKSELHNEEPIVPKHKTRPQSILEKINMFEKQSEKDVNLEDKLVNMSLSDNLDSKMKETTPSVLNTASKSETQATTNMEAIDDNTGLKNNTNLFRSNPEKVYKSNINKFNFLQTQLAEDTKNNGDTEIQHETLNTVSKKNEINDSGFKEKFDSSESTHKDESNITDDIRIAKSHYNSSTQIDCPPSETNDSIIEPQISISVPPRKKKNLVSSGKSSENKKKDNEKKVDTKLYPDHLNPFSEDEEEEDVSKDASKATSTNPFGSSDEEDDVVPPIHPPPRLPTDQTSTPAKRLIAANPFWSDGEEPSSDEEPHNGSSNMYKSSLTTSTPNLPSGTPRRKKVKAPPPPVLTVTEVPSTSMDDVASISSLSSYASTIHSDQKSYGALTPRLKKKRIAPTPPDSVSMSGCGSMEKGVDHSDVRNNSDGGRRLKGPAPGLPLPERREVKMQMSPEELQVQLDMLETQQLGLERQGVLVEQMIRDKCEVGEDAVPAPQEEVEDLVIQLCELVNEKNDLFRKQTELMYIRRQQRLEQEQADIEHEIRVIQSRPAVNRIDADKAREEQLVSRLVQIVRLRDELVQQLDAERRRERQEDLAIATSIASKRAQRNSDSNSSSMKSTEVVPTPKKNKVKDKVKKQLKKAKHSLISKKKDDSDKKEKKEEKGEKEKKSK